MGLFEFVFKIDVMWVSISSISQWKTIFIFNRLLWSAVGPTGCSPSPPGPIRFSWLQLRRSPVPRTGQLRLSLLCISEKVSFNFSSLRKWTFCHISAFLNISYRPRCDYFLYCLWFLSHVAVCFRNVTFSLHKRTCFVAFHVFLIS